MLPLDSLTTLAKGTTAATAVELTNQIPADVLPPIIHAVVQIAIALATILHLFKRKRKDDGL